MGAAGILIVDLFRTRHLVFEYSEINTFSTGRLFPVTYLVLLLYLALILIMSFVKCDFNLNLGELLTILIGIGFIILNIVGERFLTGYTGGNSENAMALAVLIYAIHFKSIEDRREKKILETTEQKTGLLNENACVSRLKEMLGYAKMEEYAAVYFDLERFGLINDKYGMEVGNRVLSEYAGILGKIVRRDELLARQGGDRFIAIVLKRNLDVFLAQLASTRVKFSHGGVDYDVTISAHVGIYNIGKEDTNAEEMISNAHLAEDIHAVVQEYRVPKKMIEIEITETIDEFPISVLKNFVDDLHGLGYKAAVDDFGSGSSSLSLLREVTFDTLEIDKPLSKDVFERRIINRRYKVE